MYPLLQTSVEFAESEKEEEPEEASVETPAEELNSPTELPSEPPVEKTISEKEMDDQFFHLCIRVRVLFYYQIVSS